MAEAATPMSAHEYMENVTHACEKVLECEKDIKPLEKKKNAAQKDFTALESERDEWLQKLPSMRNEGTDTDTELLDRLCDMTTRVEQASKKADSAKTKWQSAKSKLDEARKSMEEQAMASVDPQLRMNFDAAEVPAEKSPTAAKHVKQDAAAAKSKKTEKRAKEAAEPKQHEFGDWREAPVSQMKVAHSKVNDTMLKSLTTRGIRTMGQVEELIAGNIEGYPKGFWDLTGWGQGKVAWATEAFESVKASQDAKTDVQADPAADVSDQPDPPADEGGNSVLVKIRQATPALTKAGISAGDVVPGTRRGVLVYVKDDVVLTPADCEVVADGETEPAMA